jgi:hypothetical protein
MKSIWWPTCLLTLSRRIIVAQTWKLLAALMPCQAQGKAYSERGP